METDEPQTPDEWGQLSLCYQELQSIPNQLFSFPHSMLRLNLSHNNLTEVPDQIGRLILLRDLDVSNNRLQRIDPSISACIRLRRLSLSTNELAKIPSELSSCAMLEEIDLTNNRIDEIPESLAALPALSELRLDNNNLALLPTSLSLLPTLSVLTCTNNNSKLDIPANIQASTDMVMWCLKALHEYNQKEEAARATYQEFQEQATSAATEKRHLEETVEALKHDVAALQAERPAQYLNRKRHFLATKAKWSRRFHALGGILCFRSLRPKATTARVSVAAIVGDSQHEEPPDSLDGAHDGPNHADCK